MLVKTQRARGQVVAARLRIPGAGARRGVVASRSQGFGRREAVAAVLVALAAGTSAGGALLRRRRSPRRRWSGAERLLGMVERRQLIGMSAVVGAVAIGAAGYRLRRRRSPVRRVRDVMTENPRSLEPSMLVREAAALMKNEDVGSLPLVEGERLVGVLTDRDVVMRVVAEGRDPQAVRVGEIASRELVSAEPEQALDQALRLMARHRVRRLPVVEGGRLVGILALADVADESEADRVGSTVARISEPREQPRT
jgi:CBS domain-containing protein